MGIGGLKLSAQERVAELEARLSVRFSRPDLGLSALCHKSWLNEHPREALVDNERLEFLGDAVVDLAIGHRLMERMPEAREGELSRARASLVDERGLGAVAADLGLGELLLLGKGEDPSGGGTRPSMLASTLGAVIGALCLGDGLGAVMELVDRLLSAPLEGVVSGRPARDHKSLLQEWAQQRLRIAPTYRVIGESGPEHAKLFEVEVWLAEVPHARATGRSKKEAEQAAARETLIALTRTDPEADPGSSDAPGGGPPPAASETAPVEPDADTPPASSSGAPPKGAGPG